MFWESFFHSFGVFLHWQTYVILFIYVIINSLPLIVIMFSASKSEGIIKDKKRSFKVVQAIFQVFAVFVAVCILFPIMFGANEAAWLLPLELFATRPVLTAMVLALMLVFALIGKFWPTLGWFDSFVMFIMGVIVIIMITAIYPPLGISNVKFNTGLFMIIGIVIICSVTSWLGRITSVVITTIFLEKFKNISAIIMASSGSVFGFIPIFVYAAWIGLQIQGK